MKANVQKFTEAVCPKCGKKSSFTQKKEELEAMIEHTYLMCGRCGHKATICYTDKAIRDVLAAQKALFDAGRVKEATDNAPKVQAMLDALQARLTKAQ